MPDSELEQGVPLIDVFFLAETKFYDFTGHGC